MPDLRVFLVADDPLARAGLAVVLASLPDCIVAGQSAGDAGVQSALAVYRPDVVLWDLGWDAGRVSSSGSQTVAAGQGREPHTPVEQLAGLREDGYAVVVLLADAAYAAAVWAAGVRGLLPREASATTLGVSLQAVAQGLVVLAPAFVTALLPTRSEPPMPLTEALTRRELEVLQLVAEGLPNKTIADHLHISEHTVKFHLNALMGKLAAQSRTEAVVRATRLGLLLL
jgi:DNA-binding NarL/FixJ family response regulator